MYCDKLFRSWPSQGLACAMLGLFLASCGSDSGSIAQVPTPQAPAPIPPPETTPPTPAPLPPTDYPNPQPEESGNFRMLGLLYRSRLEGDVRVGPVPDPADNIALSYQKNLNSLQFLYAGRSSDLTYVKADSRPEWVVFALPPSPNGLGDEGLVWLRAKDLPMGAGPAIPDRFLTLQHSNLLMFEAELTDGSHFDGYFAYALPIAVVTPTVGRAAYEAVAYGVHTNYSTYRGNAEMDRVRGVAELDFDFGTGRFTGSFQAVILNHQYGPVVEGRHEVVDGTIDTAAGTFRARLVRAGAPAEGWLEGQFTGPASQEIMVRFTAPIREVNSQEWETLAGVWIGKRKPGQD